MQRSALYGAPLCPAGHLPLKGGDRQLRRRRSSCNVEDWRSRRRRPISPLEGEMSGRTEGGAKERYHLETFAYQPTPRALPRGRPRSSRSTAAHRPPPGLANLRRERLAQPRRQRLDQRLADGRVILLLDAVARRDAGRAHAPAAGWSRPGQSTHHEAQARHQLLALVGHVGRTETGREGRDRSQTGDRRRSQPQPRESARRGESCPGQGGSGRASSGVPRVAVAPHTPGSVARGCRARCFCVSGMFQMDFGGVSDVCEAALSRTRPGHRPRGTSRFGAPFTEEKVAAAG